MKTEPPNPVQIYLDQLDHPLKPEILKIREIIFSANPDLTEHIKWNAPSFCLDGEDKITFNIPHGLIAQLSYQRKVSFNILHPLKIVAKKLA